MYLAEAQSSQKKALQDVFPLRALRLYERFS